MRNCSIFAVDIGTTTVNVSLIIGGEVVDRVFFLNPQRIYGLDVVERIYACEKYGVSELQSAIVTSLNETMVNMLKRHSLQCAEYAFIGANTTMLHIFCGVSPTSIGSFPYTAVFLDTQLLQNENKPLNYVKNVYLMPSFSSYFGSDALLGIYAILKGYALELKGNRILEKIIVRKSIDVDNNHNSKFVRELDENIAHKLNYNTLQTYDCNLIVDFGTNGEIALIVGKKIYVTSVAIGPAFEGENINCGILPKNGAIDNFYFSNEKLCYHTIGDCMPKGICGRGLISLIAQLLEVGVIKFDGNFDFNIAKKYGININIDGLFITSSVFITTEDLHNILLAKSAIYSGIMTLIEKANISMKEINNVFVSGSFVNDKNAVDDIFKIKIIPIEFYKKIIISGNTCLLSLECIARDICLGANIDDILTEVSDLKNLIRGYDLACCKTFNKMFLQNLVF